MGIVRKYYTDEFKSEAVKLSESVGIVQAAKDLGVHTSNIQRWKSKPQRICSGSSSVLATEKDREIARLKKELRHIYQINEVLKKSLGIFVKEPSSTSR